MAKLSLSDLSKKMRDIDITMLSTHTENGQIAGRPMSNNGEVEYDGDSFYFTWEQSLMVSDIRRDPNVSLAFQGRAGIFGKDMFLAAVEGKAELITDKSQFKAHWTPGLDAWFKHGIDTPGVIMIKVHATRIHYWDGGEDGELML